MSDHHTALYSRVFKGILLGEDIARREDAGELLRPERNATRPLFGSFEPYFSQSLRERAEKMTYAYCLFYCFENEVRELAGYEYDKVLKVSQPDWIPFDQAWQVVLEMVARLAIPD